MTSEGYAILAYASVGVIILGYLVYLWRARARLDSGRRGK